ncbi:CoA-binding protein [Deinococcus psychrotolerans]|uniref:CoA-binding protein n=1 Tax=Deinococcus psychrotolerans TaxID=2489213 RepID=A0A3G8YE14_9DEIO|nr:CoA-binding protein [Deinococcus psychrotolerans]AZI43598.1 CoA-binding protein [Deinococcus psychrotolerans]
MTILTDPKAIVRVLEDSKSVAVIGYHADSAKPAHYVPEYLERQGYKVYGVNPALASRQAKAFGHPVVSSLTELSVPVDVVEIFRRSDKVRDHLPEILAMNPLPKVVWLQLGIKDDAVAAELSANGIEVIQDRCMLSDHRQYL